MKKLFQLALLVASLFLFSFQCKKKNPSAGCFKGRLEVQGICMNYTIKLLKGDLDPSLIESSWTDESTGKTYQDVFRLENICEFPSGIKQGDEFYFQIETNPSEGCSTCFAYYPTPSKRLAIRVLNAPCTEKLD